MPNNTDNDDDFKTLSEKTRTQIEEYLSVRSKLLQVDFTIRLTKIATALITFLIIGALLLGCLVFFSFALAHYLSSFVHSTGTGFLLTGGIFLGFIILILRLRKPLIIQPISHIIVSEMTRKLDDDDDEK
jgi:hypothetical protein